MTCEHAHMRVIRGIAIFIAASVGMLALFGVLGGGVGWAELLVMLIVGAVFAVKLSDRRRRGSAT